jgi:energy-coupling factor transporter ATP-binding protein EcfA2
MELDDRSDPPIWLTGPGNLYKVHNERKRLRLGDQPDQALLAIGRVMAADEDARQRDRGRDILWLAASLGSQEACADLFREIRAYVDEVSLPPKREEELLQLAVNWRTLATMAIAAPRVYPVPTGLAPLHVARGTAGKRRHLLSEDGVFHEEDDDIFVDDHVNKTAISTAALAALRHTPAQPKGAVIVQTIGDPGTNEGKNIAARYADVIGRMLPFSGVTPERGRIASVIEAEFPWADNVARDLERRMDIAAAVGGDRQKFRPVLFLGPSGSGKTSLAVRLAEVFGRKLTVIAAGGASDSAGVGAVTRGWSGARPCGPFLAAVGTGCCDPALLIDEIDKSPRDGGQNGSVSGTLHGMLNFDMPFQDACLMSGVDLSNMMFMATANSLDRVPGSLIDRFDVMIVKRPEPEHFPTVLSTMRQIVASENRTNVDLIPALDDEETNALYDFFKQGRCSLRTFERAFKVMLSEAATRERAMPN